VTYPRRSQAGAEIARQVALSGVDAVDDRLDM
jgi:hypothetical protein